MTKRLLGLSCLVLGLACPAMAQTNNSKDPTWWNKYQFNPTWGAALGMIYFGDSFATSDDTVRLPRFVRFDAALYVTIDEHWRAQLNVENIFNKGYWASADGDNNISPGQARTFRISAIARF